MQFISVNFAKMMLENQYENLFAISSTFRSEHCKLAIHFTLHLFIFSKFLSGYYCLFSCKIQ